MQPGAINDLYLFVGLALFAVAGFGVFWKARAALASIPALLLVLSANLEHVESFKAAFPTTVVEAKMQELDRTVDDAKEAIRQIRELAIAASEALLTLEDDKTVIAEGFGDLYKSQDTFKAKVIGALKKIGVPEERIKEVSQTDRNIVLRFYCYAAVQFARSRLPQSRWQEFGDAWVKLSRSQAPNPLSPEQCQGLFDSFRVDMSKFADYMADFRYYAKNGEQRRPDVWADGANWAFGKLPQQ